MARLSMADIIFLVDLGFKSLIPICCFSYSLLMSIQYFSFVVIYLTAYTRCFAIIDQAENAAAFQIPTH